MIDTILTTRQKYILNLINQSQGLLRDAIHEQIRNVYSYSKPTLIRDLNILLKNNLIKSQGLARATRYYPLVQNPLLRKFDMVRYFADEPDNRLGAKKIFRF